MRWSPIVALWMLSLASGVCGKAPASQPTQPATERDLADYRSKFPSIVTRHGPPPASWQDSTPLKRPSNVSEAVYESDGMKLKAWLGPMPTDGLLHPGVVFCHGGFWFGNEDWDAIKPLIDAGYVVMMPRVRGENGNPGDFEYFGHEVDDVNAAGRYLAKVPGVDGRKLFVSGHSAGGSLAALAVMMEGTPFVLSAPIGATLDIRSAAQWANQRQRDLICFDVNDTHELEQRSALLFTAGLRAPIHLFRGDADGTGKVDLNVVSLAHHFRKEATLTKVSGDHGASLDSAMPKIVALFDDYSFQRHVACDLPKGWHNQLIQTKNASDQTAANTQLAADLALIAQSKGLFADGRTIEEYAASVQTNAARTAVLANRADTAIQKQTIGKRDVATYDTTGTLSNGVAVHYRRYCMATKHYFVDLMCWSPEPQFAGAVADFEKLAVSVHESGD